MNKTFFSFLKNSQRRLPTVLSLNGSPRPLAASSSNKRPRQYSSVDSDEEDGDDTDLEYDENEYEVDGLVALRNTDFYAQLEKEQTTNAEVRWCVCLSVYTSLIYIPFFITVEKGNNRRPQRAHNILRQTTTSYRKALDKS